MSVTEIRAVIYTSVQVVNEFPLIISIFLVWFMWNSV